MDEVEDAIQEAINSVQYKEICNILGNNPPIKITFAREIMVAELKSLTIKGALIAIGHVADSIKKELIETYEE